MRTALGFAAATAPLACVALWTALPGQANSGWQSLPELPELPSLSTASRQITTQDLIYVRTRKPLSIIRLAASLGLDHALLARLNGRTPMADLAEGAWCAVPAKHRSRLLKLTTIDPGSERSTPPQGFAPASTTEAAFESGDSLASFLQRHGIEEIQLQELNPGVQNLVRPAAVSNQIMRENWLQSFKMLCALALRTPPEPALLAVRPAVSGALSWPTIPTLSSPLSTPRPGPKYQWPTKGVFTSGYGWRWGRMHKGIDIANNTGTSIHAARDGQVTYAGWMGAYGYLVEIAHDDGESTRYAHNSRLMVRKGERVLQGTRIALMGSTGRSTGPHLHFEIRRRGGSASNPLSVLPPRQS